MQMKTRPKGCNGKTKNSEKKPQKIFKIILKKVVDNKNWGDKIRDVAKMSDWDFKGMRKRQRTILLTLKKK